MDEHTFDVLHRRLTARSWAYPDPASHEAGVDEAMAAVREMLVASRPGGGEHRPDRIDLEPHRSRTG